MITSRPVEARTVMPPWNTDTFTVPGREGSLNGTVSRFEFEFESTCAWRIAAAANNMPTDAVTNAIRFMVLTFEWSRRYP
jgi:hypothetical protein